MSLDPNSKKSISRQVLCDEDGNTISDPIIKAIPFISVEHHEIHEGDHYYYCNYDQNQAVDAEIEFVFTTPSVDQGLIHFTFEVFSSLGVKIDIYEGTTGIVSGTPIILRNNNRTSTNESGVVIVKNPTSIESDGTFAAGYLAGANRAAGFTSRDKENILKPSTHYLLRMTSLANSNNISYCCDLYKH